MVNREKLDFFNKGEILLREKIRVPKVNDFCSVSKLQEWKVELGEHFESGDLLCIINNLNEKHEIKADKAGILVEKSIHENAIVEDNQVIAIFELADESKADKQFMQVGLISKFISKIKEKKNLD